MRIDNIYPNTSFKSQSNTNKEPIKSTFNIQSIESIVNAQEQVGYVHYANPDIELRMFKVESDSDELLYRVETSQNGKLIKSQIINPETVDLNNATSEELLALNNYLRDKNIYTDNFSIIDSNMMAEYHSNRYNALNDEKIYANMQLETNNIEVYMLHKKLLDVLMKQTESPFQ